MASAVEVRLAACWVRVARYAKAVDVTLATYWSWVAVTAAARVPARSAGERVGVCVIVGVAVGVSDGVKVNEGVYVRLGV